jgi:hypothetical protein
MTQMLFGEQWKNVNFNFEYINDYKLEVSNLGRVRSFNKISNGNIVKGSLVNGYRVVRLKFYKPRENETQQKLDYMQQQVFKLMKKIKEMKTNAESVATISTTEKLLDNLKQTLKKRFATDTKSRTINWHSLHHRLVADYFLQKKSDKHTVVAHLDFDKLNNKLNNLKWMTLEENYEHQKNSPFVIEAKLKVKQGYNENSKATKLTVTKVMLLKKLLNQNKPIKQLVKLFKISETQILRIKRGENWTNVEAAK